MEDAAVTDATRPTDVTFEINPKLDAAKLNEEFKANRRLHVSELLSPEASEALYHYVNEQVEWSTYLVSKGRMYEAPPEVRKEYTEKDEQELIDAAVANARELGFTYIYDSNRRVSEDPAVRAQDPSLLARFADFANSATFLDFMRTLTGVPELVRAEVHAMRFRSGHFITFHDGTRSADKEGKKRATYFYNLTPEWRVEWGGLLEFRGKEGHLVEAYAPCFNCLDVIAFPMGHWMSMVAPFIDGPAYAIQGGLYVK